jgi:hypothetical protein
MPITSTIVQFYLFDVTAKADSAPAGSDVLPFCNLGRDLLMEERPEQKRYATLEQNQFALDGSMELFPTEPQNEFWGLWSTAQSDASGAFAVPPVLQVDFTQAHSSMGLTLHFWNATEDWADDVTIQWYDATGGLLATGRYAPNKADFYCSRKVENYYRVKLTFHRTNKPIRYLKLSGLDYGVSLAFSGEDVISAKILEEVDLISDSVSVNTLNLTLHNGTGEFSILNPAGSFGVLQSRQRFQVQERSDGNALEMGTFYLSDWSNESDTQAKFSAKDSVGLLDGDPWDGDVYNTTMGTFRAALLSGYKYTLDVSLSELPIKGHLASCSKREALQQAAFACGAVVDCSRGDTIRIYPPPDRPSALVSYDRKFVSGAKVTLQQLVTGVQVTAASYSAGTAAEELYKETLPVGTVRVNFTEPVVISTLSVTGASITGSCANWTDISVPAAGEVKLTGIKYSKSAVTILCAAKDVPANATPNIIKVENASLLCKERASEIAQSILSRYADRVQQQWRMVAGTELLADRLIVESYGGEKVRGSLQKMSLDLTGGFLANCTLLGSRISTIAAAYSGTEIYAGERSLI